MPPKTPSKEALEELSELRARLAEAERELERAACRTDEEPPEGVKEFIAAVSKVDLPAFWEADPVLWFRQCESAFRRAGTVSSGVKFDHVVCKLPNAVSLSCRSLLLSINPEDKDGYERLKAHLCKAYGKTKWQLGYALLTLRVSATAAPLSCFKIFVPSSRLESRKAHFFSVCF